jgi:acyl carrier protein
MKNKNLSEVNLKKILKDIFFSIAPEVDFEKIDLNLPLRDQIDIDSYDFYRLLVRLDELTGIEIPDSEVRRFKNVNNLIGYILKKNSELVL